MKYRRVWIDTEQIGLAQCLVTFASGIARPGYSGSGRFSWPFKLVATTDTGQETTQRDV